MGCFSTRPMYLVSEVGGSSRRRQSLKPLPLVLAPEQKPQGGALEAVRAAQAVYAVEAAREPNFNVELPRHYAPSFVTGHQEADLAARAVHAARQAAYQGAVDYPAHPPNDGPGGPAFLVTFW